MEVIWWPGGGGASSSVLMWITRKGGLGLGKEELVRSIKICKLRIKGNR